MICEICLKDKDEVKEFTSCNIKICRDCDSLIQKRTRLSLILKIIIYGIKNLERFKTADVRELEIDFLRKLIKK